MSAFEMSDYGFDRECDELAQEIFDDIRARNEGPAADLRDAMLDAAHETADGHEWAIYTHKALGVVAGCNTDLGEELAEDCGEPTTDIAKLASLIVYGEMRRRIEMRLEELIDAAEEEEEEGAAE